MTDLKTTVEERAIVASYSSDESYDHRIVDDVRTLLHENVKLLKCAVADLGHVQAARESDAKQVDALLTRIKRLVLGSHEETAEQAVASYVARTQGLPNYALDTVESRLASADPTASRVRRILGADDRFGETVDMAAHRIVQELFLARQARGSENAKLRAVAEAASEVLRHVRFSTEDGHEALDELAIALAAMEEL